MNKELWTISPRKNKSLRNYYNRFTKLIRDCGIVDDHISIIDKFTYSLPYTYQEKLLIIKVLNSLYTWTIVSTVVNLVIMLKVSLKLVSSNSTSSKSNTTVIMISTKPKLFFYRYHKEHINYNSSDY